MERNTQMKSRGREMQIQSDRYGVYPSPVRGIFYTEGHNNSNRSKWGGVGSQRGSGSGVVLVMDETEGVTLTTAGFPGASRPPMKTHHYWIMTLLERQRESKLQNQADFLSIQHVTGGHNCKTNVLVWLNLLLNACVCMNASVLKKIYTLDKLVKNTINISFFLQLYLYNLTICLNFDLIVIKYSHCPKDKNIHTK